MKKTFAYALLILTALYSCEEGKQEEPVLPETTPDEIYLNVSPHTLTFDETDASKNIITVSTNTNWKATVDNSELKINRTEGTSKDTSISITEAPEGKTCKLTISTIPANGEKTISKEVSISRAAAVVTPDRTEATGHQITPHPPTTALTHRGKTTSTLTKPAASFP